jgi:ankyrin repeat protein
MHGFYALPTAVVGDNAAACYGSGPVFRKNKYGMTPIMWEADKGNAEIARLLIDHGADVINKEDARTLCSGNGSGRGQRRML